MESKEISIEREKNEYLIKMGDKSNVSLVTTWARTEPEVIGWLTQVRQIYGKKNKQPLVVGLSADRSLHYSNSSYLGRFREDPLELLQLCVGNHILLWHIEMTTKQSFNVKKSHQLIEQPKSLKDFLCDSRTIVVGVKIDDIVKKLEKETKLLIPKTVDLRDLAKKKLGKNNNFEKYKVEKLANVVLGDEMKVTRPSKLSWWSVSREVGWGYSSYLSDDVVKYASLEVFLAAEMGSKLL